MSPIALAGALAVAAVSGDTTRSGCTYSGARAWSDQTRYLVADCPLQLPSPSGAFSLRIGADGRLSVWSKSGKALKSTGVRKIEPPAMVTWSPASDAFVVDDGEGSGLSSKLVLFRIGKDGVASDLSVNRQAVSWFRSVTRCPRHAADPNVWGVGWSPRGEKLFIFIQPTVNEPCGDPSSYAGMVVKTSTGKVLKTLTMKQTKQSFGSLVPKETLAP